MKLWEHTFTELTGGGEPHGDVMGSSDQTYYFLPGTIVPLADRPLYATALLQMLEPSGAHQALLHFDGGQWVPLGAYLDDTIEILPEARGKGLAEELLIRCAEYRTAPLSSAFTNRGFSLLRRAHRLSIQRALVAKLPVPATVLSEYPDLASPAR